VRGDPSILSTFLYLSNFSKNLTKRRNRDNSVSNKKLLDGDLLLLLYSDTERPPRMVTLGTDPFDSFDP
jgi:hypothetical protein